jgi:hypothetical protein
VEGGLKPFAMPCFRCLQTFGSGFCRSGGQALAGNHPMKRKERRFMDYVNVVSVFNAVVFGHIGLFARHLSK